MKVVVTGGAGFIGSHIVDRYLADGHQVVVLDDLSTGDINNLAPGVHLRRGSVVELEDVAAAVEGATLVFHLAASRSVPRSVEDPIGTDRGNTLGTLNVLVASRDAGVRRVVISSSSSVYGGVAPLPTSEAAPVTPKSPYAVSKAAAESYARVFSELYGLETVALRYFNVFGPRQSPQSQYAAVIPLFIEALVAREPLVVFGDGTQTRDFTYIDDVVDANVAAATADATVVSGRAYNVGQGGELSILDLVRVLSEILETESEPTFAPARPGDVRRSRADITAARRDLGFAPAVAVEEGLRRAVAWFTSSDPVPTTP